ncbi:MAG: hypothetical protein S0880_35195 [Actinomycetota bacterium]|nr:hypothetical protein [Actinomycetota bacterium]
MYNQPKPPVGTGRSARSIAWVAFVVVTLGAIVTSTVVAVRAVDDETSVAVAAGADGEPSGTTSILDATTTSTSSSSSSSSSSSMVPTPSETVPETSPATDGPKGPCAEDAGVDRCLPVEPPGGSGSTPTTAVGAGEPGAPDNPLALGTTTEVGPWDVTMTAFDADATEEVYAADTRNALPVNGAYVLVTVVATYRGSGTESAFATLAVDLVGDDGEVYTDLGCRAFAPDDMYFEPAIAAGETVEGTFCLDAPVPSAPALVAIRPLTGFATTPAWYTAP